MKKFSNACRIVAPVALAVVGLGTAAVAGPYPGSLATLTNGAANTQSLFTLSGSAVTVTGDISGANKYYLDGTQLIGFRSIYLVKSDGSATNGLSTVASGGFVKDGTTAAKTLYLTAPALGGYTGYDDGGPGKGFPDGSHWLVIGDPTLAGKAASNNDTFGSFDFSGAVGGSDIGLDYILSGGATGRAYFSVPPRSVTPVPEPGSMASLALGSLGLAGLMLRARKRPAKAC